MIQENESEDIRGLVIAEYNLETEKNINYLIDYSRLLIKLKKSDETIIKWQIENKEILKPLGLDAKKLKQVKY